MAHYLPSGLARYHGVILSLIPYVRHEKFQELVTSACKKHHPSSLPSVHQEIVMEIRKLSRPCTRCIDLRTYFEDCEAFAYEQMTHHLDPAATETFRQGVEKNNGVFSLVLYHQIIESAKCRYAELVQSKPQQSLTQSRDSASEVHAVEEQTLINTLFCTTPKLSHSSKLSWSPNSWTDDSLSIHRLDGNLIELVRFDQGRLRIKFKHKKPEQEQFYLYVYEHDVQIIDAWRANHPLPLCVSKIRSRTVADGEVWDVQLNDKNAPEILSLVAGYLQAKVKANHRLLHEQFDPLRSSILAKCHSQWWRAHSSQVGILCTLTGNLWTAAYRMNNERNQGLMQLTSGVANDWMERLVELPEFQVRLHHASLSPVECTLGLFLHQGKMWVETRSEKLYHASWRQAVCAGHARLMKCRIFSIDPLNAAHIPSALPDHVGVEFALLNQPPRKKVRASLASCQRSVYFDDISDIFSVLPAISRPRFELHILSSASLLSEREDASVITDLFVPKVDLRLEDRFECALSVSIRSQKRPHLHSSGITENVSVSGLRVKLHELPRWEPGEVLEVDLHIPFGQQAHALSKQPYQLIGHSQEGVCRLAFAGTNNLQHVADKLIQQYIYRNIEELKLNSSEHEHLPGLATAVRNALTANRPETAFFVQQGKHGFRLRAADTSALRMQLSQSPHSDQSPQLLSLLLRDKHSRAKILQLLSRDPEVHAASTLILVLPSGQDNERFSVYDAEQLKTNSGLEAQVDQLRRAGTTPIALKISASMATQPIQKEFIDELTRLKRINPGHAEDVEHIIETTAAVGSVQDVSSELWRWFDTVRGRSFQLCAVSSAA